MTSDCDQAGLIDVVQLPKFYGLLQADAILHVRLTGNSRYRDQEYKGRCETLHESPAVVLRMVSLSGAPLNRMTTARARSYEGPLKAGAEYLVFHRPGWPPEDVFIDFNDALTVKDGRVFGGDDARLEIHDGTSLDEALVRLREAYKSHTQYRKYDDLASAGALETLRYKTGWIEIGVMDSNLRKWADEQPFAFEKGPNGRILPRPGDRILLKASHRVYILDFGSRGEDLRVQPPALGRLTDLADETGTRASAHVPYTVADVQCRRWGGTCSIWMRLIAK